jgi:hypothetical protein
VITATLLVLATLWAVWCALWLIPALLLAAWAALIHLADKT